MWTVSTATRQLRAHGDAPPVLILTTFDDDDVLWGAIEAGAAGFVLKDTPAEELIAATRAVAGGAAWLDPHVADRVLAALRRRAASHREAVTRVDVLTEREHDVLRRMARGATNQEIATALFVSEATVKTHIGSIFAKLGRATGRGDRVRLRPRPRRCLAPRWTAADDHGPMRDVGARRMVAACTHYTTPPGRHRARRRHGGHRGRRARQAILDGGRRRAPSPSPLSPGELFGLLGTNGAGKTTTSRSSKDCAAATAATSTCSGWIRRSDGDRLRRLVGSQLQAAALPARMRVGEALRFFAGLHPDPRPLADLAEEWQLAALQRRHVRSAVRRANASDCSSPSR